MWISASRGVALVLPPKTGTHSLLEVMTSAFPDAMRMGGDHYFPDHPRDIAQCEHYTWIVAVRNPFARTVSYYMHNHGTGVAHDIQGKELATDENMNDRVFGPFPRLWVDNSFAELMVHPTWRQTEHCRQISLEYWLRTPPKIDHFLRLEHLAEDLAAAQVPALAHQTPPHLFKQIYERPWWEEYTPEAEQAVRELCHYDFERLGNFYSDRLADAIP